ncbi:MAG: DUF3471 domain-containing protein [Chitinophagaceae bacterium]|nr:DUF3471 domain-containing protein [Chitinophagaceae bacterium]
MKRIIFFLLISFYASAVSAQTPAPSGDSLKIYTGKYKFPEGSAVAEVRVTITNGVLYADSDIGSSELKHSSGDVFNLLAYDGTATFKRSTEGKVNGVRIEVGDILLEGPKAEDTISALNELKASNCLVWR